MKPTARLPLAALRVRAQEAGTTRDLLDVRSQLEGDPRAGACLLARQLERRIEATRRERQRWKRLCSHRTALRRAGAKHVAGVDEVGVGPLAGPVVAAAVVLPDQISLPGLDDSKRVRPAAREVLAEAIRAQAVSWSVAELWPEEIDRLNIYHATLQAMRRAVMALSVVPDHVLVDARTIPDIDIPQTALVGGDGRDASIAAASIVAKVYRDALMRRLDREHPGYGFARHMGYATEEHRSALRRLGPSPVHRRSFAPCSQPGLW